MRLSEEHIHESLLRAMEEYGVVAQASATTAGAVQTPYHRSQKEWWKEYGRGVSFGALFWISTFFGGIAVVEAFNKPAGAALVFAAMAGGIGHGIWAYKRAKNQTTIPIIEALIPALTDPSLKIYAQTLVAVFQTEGIAEQDRFEILKQMRSVMEDRERIAKQKERLTQMAGDLDARAQLEDEIAALDAKVESTSDPSAREVFVASLDIAKSRLARWERYAPLADRVDAQAAMIEQTLRGYAESVARMGVAPRHAADELDSLRSRLANVRGYAEAVEQAIEEVRSL